MAADAHERANGRTYTELQIALPRELDPSQRQELAREATRELLGDRFAYTVAVHTPLAKDNIAQPHMHLMFTERAVTEATREMSEECFFKRNGAKKDPEWDNGNKPEEVREKWVEMMIVGLIDHADRLGKSAQSTQQALSEQIQEFAQVQQWAVNAALELQKRAGAAVQKSRPNGRGCREFK